MLNSVRLSALGFSLILFGIAIYVSPAVANPMQDEESHGRLGQPRNRESLLLNEKEKILNTLSDRDLWRQAADDPEKLVEFYAVIHLSGRLGIEDAIPVLEEIDSKLCTPASAEPATFSQALWLEVIPALVRLGRQDLVPLLVGYMHAEVGLSRIVAAKRMLDFSVDPAVPELRKGIDSRTLWEVMYSVEALASIRDSSAKAYLLEGLRYPNQVVRVQCAVTAARYGWVDGKSELLEAFAHGDGDIKFMAAEGLAWLGSREALDDICKRLSGPDPYEKHAATGILGDLEFSPARQQLESIATDNETPLMTRTYAIRALGNIGSPQSLEILTNLGRVDETLVDLASAAAIVQILENVDIPMDSAYLRLELQTPR